MGIEKFISKVCVQTAVYWGNPMEDGFGGKTYDDGVEIPCRWNDKREMVNNSGITTTGGSIVSNAEVLVTQDLDEQGWLYLGTLDELKTLGYSPIVCEFRPNDIEGAYMIQKFVKTPLIKKTDKFVRTVYL